MKNNVFLDLEKMSQEDQDRLYPHPWLVIQNDVNRPMMHEFIEYVKIKERLRCASVAEGLGSSAIAEQIREQQ